MQSSHPRVFLDICKQQWYDATKALSLLLVAKKIYMKYGAMVATRSFLQIVYDVDKDVGTMLSITDTMKYNTAAKVGSLLAKIQILCKDLICTVESSKPVWENIVIKTLAKHEQDATILVDTHITQPWLHITTWSHRYHRDIESDLDALLQH